MFHSTRGSKLISSPEAILNGLAPDGGLYVIDKIPTLDYHKLINCNYQEMAATILNLFFPEFSYDELKKEIDEAYSSFDTKNVVELKKCEDVFFLELFHGPTLAFKDLALVVLPRLMKLSKEKLGVEKNITILTATSGDTGGAALNGFRQIDGISIVVLYPDGGVSPVQEAQMCSFRANNAKVLALTGNFDDCQSFVKEFFSTHKDLSLSSANSINIARLIPQVVYYFYSYVYLLKNGQIKDNELLNFTVPTGNFGNIFAAFYAKNMGLPIGKLVCASNKNQVLTDFFNTNNYNRLRELYKTNSPSMDILVSSNLERLLYYGTNENQAKVSSLMDDLKTKGSYDFTNPFNEFMGFTCDEEKTIKTIREVYDEYNYLIDPHTAVAYDAYKKSNLDGKMVIVSTASPYKFPQTVLDAFDLEEKDPFKAIDVITDKFALTKPAVLNYPKPVAEIVEKEVVTKYVEDVIKCFK